MAAEDINRLEIEKQVTDDTICCCICTNVYTDPKALPCIHTFCMKCLQENGIKIGKGPGDEMPCPLCRRQFKIPEEGFPGLPNNSFIAKLIQAANVSNPSESSRDICDVCLEDHDETGKEIPKANMYCTDCKQKLCEECCRQHRKFKLNKNHKLISINDQQVGLSDENAKANLAPSVCEFHEQKVLDVYCGECKTVECAICFIDGHKHHEGSHVSKYVDDFRKQIESNIETITGCSSKTRVKKEELIKIKEDMQQTVERLELDVINRRDELKQFADSQANFLLQSLSSLRQSKLKEIQIEGGDFDALLSCLQSYSSYCQKMMAKGSASDICRAVSDLSVRAVELEEQCHSLIERKIEFFKVSFTRSEITECLEDDNLIGEIEDDCESSQSKTRTSKFALIKRQSNEIDLLKEDINLKRREKETFRLENEQLKMSVNSEKTTNKTLQVDIAKLRQELETQRKAVEDLLKGRQESNAEWERMKTDLSAKILDVEQKREEERKTSTKENEQLISQKQELQRLLDKLRSEYRLDATLVQTIRTKAAEEKKKSIQGLTILDKELFVVSEKSSEVEVYNSMTLTFSRQWSLKELIQPQDIVSCGRNKCLYIFDYKGYLSWSNEILRVDPNGNLIKKWLTGTNFGYSLSVTNESNVILPVYNNNKLNEYSPDGQLIREVNIQAGPGYCEIWHAKKLTSGDFVVSLRSVKLFPSFLAVYHGVCIVDRFGNAKKLFGGKFTSTIGYLNVPFHLSVDGNGFVMVVDRENSRVLLLDSDLKFRREILSKEEKHGLRCPTRILLDAPNGRLLVADNDLNNQRILIFNVN